MGESSSSSSSNSVHSFEAHQVIVFLHSVGFMEDQQGGKET